MIAMAQEISKQPRALRTLRDLSCMERSSTRAWAFPIEPWPSFLGS